MYQDTLRATIHVDKMDSEMTYKMRLALVPGKDFAVGVPEYQYVDVFPQDLVGDATFAKMLMTKKRKVFSRYCLAIEKHSLSTACGF